MESSLPYQIPGPAGGISIQPRTQTATPQKPGLDLFRTTPWLSMLAHLNRKIPSSIALLRRNALSNDFVKLSSLPVLIDSLAYVGKDASVLLRDPTGYVRGTLHAEVFKERKDMLERGVVILLNGVRALAYLEESHGFRTGEDAVHLSVQACHVSEVFKSDGNFSSTPSSGSLLDDYEPQAKHPKPVVKPIITRPPLRERNYSQPLSCGFQSDPRGGAAVRGRAQHSYTSPQSRPSSQHRNHEHRPGYRRHQLHNSNVPPHHQNVSHQRLMLGSNQHKRPFRPPQMRPNCVERGMSPPQKRPNVRRIRGTHDQSRQQSRTVVAITDDQLDSLLGDLDVDAMIAAHGRSVSLPGQSAPSVVGKGPLEKGSSESSARATDKGLKEGLEPSPSTKPIDSTEPSIAKGRTVGTHVVDPSVAKSRSSGDSSIVHTEVTKGKCRGHEDGQHHAAIARPWASNRTESAAKCAEMGCLQSADHRIMPSVNPDMVDSLFDGLDTNDFM